MNTDGADLERRGTRQAASYGNWIRWPRLVALAALAVACTGLAALVWNWTVWGAVLTGLLGLVCGATAGYLAYLYLQFSDRGGGLQRRLWSLAVDGLEWDGCGVAVDIGTGNGALAIMLAERYPDCTVIGIDTWGSGWSYSQETCQQNAKHRGVADRVEFRTASASGLPFDNGQVDAVVSHFVFHEVKDAASAIAVVAEALRIIRPGGAFSFQDMFNDPKTYGPPHALAASIRELAGTDTELLPLRDLTHLPPLTSGRRTLGTAARLSGTTPSSKTRLS